MVSVSVFSAGGLESGQVALRSTTTAPHVFVERAGTKNASPPKLT